MAENLSDRSFGKIELLLLEEKAPSPHSEIVLLCYTAISAAFA